MRMRRVVIGKGDHREPLVPPRATGPTASHWSHREPLVPPRATGPTASHWSHWSQHTAGDVQK
ncbi:hypothetical protein EYF80_042442 [Liparis tanakae]|uniref:Uncharacterized protein n=1 Tax=Liparis tanakae TaxID=230148 RepID=A0A4Z2G3A3_9TELE|nr:hypothetical protein EYF80_042442 [Liparis tanakae]